MLTLIVACAVCQASPVTFDVKSGSGLELTTLGVPVVQGSWFQVYEQGWTKGYYSSTYGSQTVEPQQGGGFRVRFRSDDGRVTASQTYTPTPEGLQVECTALWSGDHAVRMESAAGMVWAQAMSDGNLTVDGQPTRSLAPSSYSTMDIGERRYGPGEARKFEFTNPVGKLELTTNGPPMVAFDARGYNQDWAAGKELIWIGSLDAVLEPGKPLTYRLEWKFEPTKYQYPATIQLVTKAQPTDQALMPRSRHSVFPTPKREVWIEGKTARVPIGLRLKLPKPLSNLEDVLANRVARLWNRTDRPHKPAHLSADVSDLGLPPEGYRIKIDPNSAIVTGQDAAGLAHGLRTLAELAFVLGDELVWPCGELTDWPALSWRGVHLFVGPKALEFHKRLFEDVLLPLRINKAVLQCERTDWLAAPGTKTSITTSREALKAEFDFLRSRGVEPIPLIQSFGHMEWLFANNANLDLAFNRDVPYAIDPRKKAAQQMVLSIWDEAIALLHPKTVHWGLDEVDMRGFPEDQNLVTDLWTQWLPVLAENARKHGVRPMLWGDMALAPGEAPDATNSDNPQTAAKRRAVIPKNAFIADWHYKADARPATFGPVTRLWKQQGFSPIASTWFSQKNIQGFGLAAVEEGTGLLQTTWAGYTSDADNAVRSWSQLVAYAAAAQMAWTGVSTSGSGEDAQPDTVMARLFFEPASPIRPASGRFLRLQVEGPAPNRPAQIGDTRFLLAPPIALRNVLTSSGAAQPTAIEFTIDRSTRTLALAISSQTHCQDGEVIGELLIQKESGSDLRVPIRYGYEVRQAKDQGALIGPGGRSQGWCLFKVPIPPVQSKRRAAPPLKVQLKAVGSYAGLTLGGITEIGG